MRRDLVAGGALGLVWAPLACPVCNAQTVAHRRVLGCALPADGARRVFGVAGNAARFVSGEEPIIERSGDAGFDLALARTLARIGAAFSVWPGFAYFQEERGAQNAFATKTARLNGTDGTVLFGRNLLRELLARSEAPDAAVAAVCAHEFGHILQFRRNLDKRLLAGQRTVKRVELQADYFAGYFAGLRKRERPDFPAAVFAATQYSFGDDRIEFENHHGTPDERADAIQHGFLAAFRQRLPLEEAIAASTSYAAGL